MQNWALSQTRQRLVSSRADWWTIFNDPVLNGLEEKVATNNYTLATPTFAAYEQERALVAEQRAALLPTINASGSATVSKSAGGGSEISSGGTVIPGGRGAVENYSLQLGGTWEPDLWGKVRRRDRERPGTAQASYADLVNAKLSAEMELPPTTSPCERSTSRSASTTTLWPPTRCPSR